MRGPALCFLADEAFLEEFPGDGIDVGAFDFGVFAESGGCLGAVLEKVGVDSGFFWG